MFGDVVVLGEQTTKRAMATVLGHRGPDIALRHTGLGSAYWLHKSYSKP